MLAVNSMSNERARGCVFAEKFESATHVAKNRGTVTGVVPIDFGATFPSAVGSWIIYTVGGTLNQTALTFVSEFVPYFAANDGAGHVPFDSTNGAIYTAFKGAGNELGMYIQVPGTIISVAYASYIAYWNEYKRNVLVCVFNSGAHYMYLNGVQIGTSNAGTLIYNPDSLYIGNNRVNSAPFYGKVLSTRVFGSALTLQEARDYYNNSVF